MIGDALTFLRDHLNDHLARLSGAEATEPEVEFVETNELELVRFKQDVVSVMLVNVEEERVMRTADRYSAVGPDGAPMHVSPEIRLNLYVLFVARFAKYEAGLQQLSRIIEHFQRHRVLDHAIAPALSPGIEKLTLELVTMPFSEQNEIWNTLRVTYLPSVLYRVRLIAMRDSEPEIPARVSESIVALGKKETEGEQ